MEDQHVKGMPEVLEKHLERVSTALERLAISLDRLVALQATINSQVAPSPSQSSYTRGEQ